MPDYKEIQLQVMTDKASTTIAEQFNTNMAIHLPDGSGIIVLTKEQAMQFFSLKEK